MNTYVTTDETIEALRVAHDGLDLACRRIKALGQTPDPAIQDAVATAAFTLDKSAGLLRWDADGNPISEAKP